MLYVLSLLGTSLLQINTLNLMVKRQLGRFAGLLNLWQSLIG
jgi:hypothetical protein